MKPVLCCSFSTKKTFPSFVHSVHVNVKEFRLFSYCRLLDLPFLQNPSEINFCHFWRPLTNSYVLVISQKDFRIFLITPIFHATSFLTQFVNWLWLSLAFKRVIFNIFCPFLQGFRCNSSYSLSSDISCRIWHVPTVEEWDCDALLNLWGFPSVIQTFIMVRTWFSFQSPLVFE